MSGSNISGSWATPPASGSFAAVDLSNILPVAGVNFNGQVLSNVADPVNPQDVITLNYFNTNPPAGVADVDLGNILPVAPVNFNSQRLANVANPVNPQDVVTLDYFNTNATPGAANQFLSNLLAPTNINQSLTYNGAAAPWVISTPNNNAAVTATLRITAGVAGNSLTSGPLILSTADTVVSSTSNTGDILIQSGRGISGAGPNFTSGNVTLQSGLINNSGTIGTTGTVNIFTGNNSANSGTTISGGINIQTGIINSSVSAASRSGNINIASGSFNSATGIGSGNITIASGSSNAATASGNITINSGVGGSTGNVSINSAASTNGDTGNISLSTGTPTAGTRGNISLSALFINYNYTPNQNHVWESGATANRPGAPVNGTTYFDITLGIPIWFFGGNWVDATGTPV